MKPGDRVRINIPTHPIHGSEGTIVKQDENEWDEGQVVWIVKLDSFRRLVGIDETELENE
jgi:hypothetical protein